MITSKQRAFLRSKSNNLDAIFQIGKGGVSPETTQSIDEALESRELIKITVLGNCDFEVREVAETLSGRTRSEIVQVMGKKITLYRKSKKKPIIELP